MRTPSPLLLALALALAGCCGRIAAPDPIDDPDADTGYPRIGPSDGDPAGCPDGPSPFLWAVTAHMDLLRFDPRARSFTSVGKLACGVEHVVAYSMGVDRKGFAYVEGAEDEPFGDFRGIFRASTTTGACAPTELGDERLVGMSFATAKGSAGEELFTLDHYGLLRAFDADSGTSRTIGKAAVTRAELTGTGDGRLFAFAEDDTGALLAELDPKTAETLAMNRLREVHFGKAWALGTWGGAFYLFTAPDDSGTIVHRYDPRTSAVERVAAYGDYIVGAGASTCSPTR